MLLLDAPQRIADMAYDSSSLIRFTAHLRQSSLDSLKRPAVLVEANDAEYPPTAAGIEKPTETFILSVVGQKYGVGAPGAAELELRQVAHDLAVYFWRRSQLQFSNLRGAKSSELPPLTGVESSRLSRRSFVTTVTRGEDGEGSFWGTEFTLTLTLAARALEVLVPNRG